MATVMLTVMVMARSSAKARERVRLPVSVTAMPMGWRSPAGWNLHSVTC